MKKNKSKANKPAEVAVQTEPVYRRLVSLNDLEALSQRFPVRVLLHGQYVELELRRLTPAETRVVKLWSEKALPPELPAEKEGGERRYDLNNPEYKATKELNRCTARNYAVYQSLPVEFWHGIEDPKRLSDPVLINEFIEGRAIEDSALEYLFGWLAEERTLVSEAEKERRLNFIYGSSSQKN